MDSKKYNVILGCLLHDTGKLRYRHYDKRNHSISGRDFLVEELELSDKEILNMVFTHHHKDLMDAKFEKNHIAYISYIADNIASFSDRRRVENGAKKGFDPFINLQSVFNLLNNNDRTGYYEPKMLQNNSPAFPTINGRKWTEEDYGKILNTIKDNLKNIENTKDYLESYLQVLESTLSFVPSSSNIGEYVDISLYDHVKLTAAYGSSIFDYLESKSRYDYENDLFKNRESFYDEKAFLLCSLDLSGIQNFIYNIIKKDALKALRSRSFYLELILEAIIDEILDRLELTRANLIYSGGGGCYLILGNTEKAKMTLNKIKEETNKWFMEEFGVDLYLTLAYEEASANNFRDKPQNSYSQLFKNLSNQLSQQKMTRYTRENIEYLNTKMKPDGDLECNNCNRTDTVNENGYCEMCDSIIKVSSSLIDKDYLLITKEEKDFSGLSLPFGQWIYPVDDKYLRAAMKDENAYVRSYSKNNFHTGKRISTNLWMGDYTYDKFISDLAEDGSGINRVAVLRADVDNLGKAFIQGFVRNEDRSLVSLSRTATLSRMFSMFFKSNINYLLENPKFILDGRENTEQRKCNIIYSGGDDIFLVGQWADVIGFAIDLQEALGYFTEDSVTISAGVGIFPSKYPISLMAEETARLGAAAKDYSTTINGVIYEKNAISLFENNMTFSWEQFKKKVVEEKLDLLRRYMEIMYKDEESSGNSMLYKILDYLRNIEDKINFPRLLYLIARKKPNSEEGKTIQRELSEKFYIWAKNEESRKELEMAIILYVYENRGEN